MTMQQDKGRALPKFGDWDVNNPTSAEGFTVIFNKARNEKKRNRSGGAGPKPQNKNKAGLKPDPKYEYPPKPMKKWFCCGWVNADGSAGVHSS